METELFLHRTLADIIDEVKRLRAEKNSLTESNNALRRQIFAQRLIPDLYASQLAETKRFLRTVVRRCNLQLPSLPPEILLAIFRMTQPPGPPYRHPPSILRGPRNPWLDSLKMKKALVLVCKAWSASATELLYSDIVLRRMGQTSALARTFRGDLRQNLANLVRAIRVDMCVVLTHCTDVAREDFEYILTHCKMLHSFVYIPHPQFDFQPYDFACGTVPTSPAAFNPTWILDLREGRAGSRLVQSLKARLLTLHLDLTMYEGSFLPLAYLLSSAPCLTSLELGNMAPRLNNAPSATSLSLPALLLPALKTLHIHCDFPPFIQYVTAQWTMPCLESLTCMAPSHIPTPLLDAHATRLTYLHFMYVETPHDMEANTVLLPYLHRLCPRIVHLVLVIVPEECTALNIHSPTLHYLDIYAESSVVPYRAIALAPTARAPQLRVVRMVLNTHAFVSGYFHPTHMPGSPNRALEDVSRIPGVQELDERADWLMSTSGQIPADFPEWCMRQHPWAVVIDRSGLGIPPGTFLPGEDENVGGETGSESEYEYESLPSSPADSESDTSGDEALVEGGLGDGRDDQGMGWNSDVHWHATDQDSDSDMECAWIKLADVAPPIPTMVMFVDDLLDSTPQRQYDRETVLERFSQSQVGDFILG